MRDPITPTDVTGEARNRRLELDVSGEIWPDVRAIASYAYIDSEITKDRQAIFNDDFTEVIGFNDGNQGNRLFAGDGGSRSRKRLTISSGAFLMDRLPAWTRLHNRSTLKPLCISAPGNRKTSRGACHIPRVVKARERRVKG